MSKTMVINWGNRPLRYAVLLMGVDVLWILLLHLGATVKQWYDLPVFGFWWNAIDGSLSLWNVAHSPIRFFLEPLLFPVMTSHPFTPGPGIFPLFQGLCVLQFGLLGGLVGVVVDKVSSGTRPVSK